MYEYLKCNNSNIYTVTIENCKYELSKNTKRVQTRELDKDNLLPNVHRIASLVKRWLWGTHQSYVNS